MASVFYRVDELQCPTCRFNRRCPARKVLGKHPDDAMALTLMRTGRCSQYRERIRNERRERP